MHVHLEKCVCVCVCVCVCANEHIYFVVHISNHKKILYCCQISPGYILYELLEAFFGVFKGKLGIFFIFSTFHSSRILSQLVC